MSKNITQIWNDGIEYVHKHMLRVNSLLNIIRTLLYVLYRLTISLLKTLDTDWKHLSGDHSGRCPLANQHILRWQLQQGRSHQRDDMHQGYHWTFCHSTEDEAGVIDKLGLDSHGNQNCWDYCGKRMTLFVTVFVLLTLAQTPQVI